MCINIIYIMIYIIYNIICIYVYRKNYSSGNIRYEDLLFYIHSLRKIPDHLLYTRGCAKCWVYRH